MKRLELRPIEPIHRGSDHTATVFFYGTFKGGEEIDSDPKIFSKILVCVFDHIDLYGDGDCARYALSGDHQKHRR